MAEEKQHKVIKIMTEAIKGRISETTREQNFAKYCR
jgi:hypothetical protein